MAGGTFASKQADKALLDEVRGWFRWWNAVRDEPPPYTLEDLVDRHRRLLESGLPERDKGVWRQNIVHMAEEVTERVPCPATTTVFDREVACQGSIIPGGFPNKDAHSGGMLGHHSAKIGNPGVLLWSFEEDRA